MNRTRRRLLAAGIASALPGIRFAGAQGGRIEAMRFSELQAGGPLHPEMKPWEFGGGARPTRYSLVSDDNVVVLRADAERSTSGIVRAVRFEPRAYPVMAWRRKVLNLPERGDIRTKAGDDFAARVYVTFDLDPATLPAAERMKLSFARAVYGENVPAAALCYVWDAKSPRDTIVPNAYSDRVRMIVAESGTARTGQWVDMKRNVHADYLRAFGTEPQGVTGVIVSTDTDNTGESAVAFYGDISFGPPEALGATHNRGAHAHHLRAGAGFA